MNKVSRSLLGVLGIHSFSHSVSSFLSHAVYFSIFHLLVIAAQTIPLYSHNAFLLTPILYFALILLDLVWTEP